MPRTIRFHLDENCPQAIADGLRRRGIDVMTTPELGPLSATDEEQMANTCHHFPELLNQRYPFGRRAVRMSNTSPTGQDSALQSGPRESPPVEPTSPALEMEVLNDDVMIEVPPDRPSGTIHVTLVYEGRSTPLPADDPWAE